MLQLFVNDHTASSKGRQAEAVTLGLENYS